MKRTSNDKVPLTSTVLKPVRRANEDAYDFSLLDKLRDGPRDLSRPGRPPGIQETRKRFRRDGCSASSDVETGIDATHDQVHVPTEDVHQISLSHAETYLVLIKQHHGLHALNSDLTAFTLSEYNSTSSTLMANKYVLLSRKAISFADEDVHWVYGCNCDPSRDQLVKAYGNRIERKSTDFFGELSTCVHVKVVIRVLEGVDTMNNIHPRVIPDSDVDDAVMTVQDTMTDDVNHEHPTANENLQELSSDGHTSLWAVHTDAGYGIIEDDKATQRCLSCRASHQTFCPHVTYFKQVVYNNHDTVAERAVSRFSHTKAYKAPCYSTLPIPHASTPTMQAVYRKAVNERFLCRDNDGHDDYDTLVVLTPSIDVCCMCNSNHLSRELRTQSATLYLPCQVCRAYVWDVKCDDCGTLHHYDGSDQCVINMGNYIMAHEILRRFMYNFLYGRATIYGEYTVLMRQYNDSGYLPPLDYAGFKNAWYAFLDLCDINYSDAFLCPVCLHAPDTVIMDGTSVSFRKSQLAWECLTDDDPSPIYDDPCNPTDRMKERTLLPRQIRTPLLAYITPRKGLTIQAANAIVADCQRDVGEPIMNLIAHILNDSIGVHDIIYVKPVWRNLISILCTVNPFDSFIPPCEEYINFLSESFLLRGAIFEHDDVLSRIQQETPALFNAICALRADFPFDLMHACMPTFREKCLGPFNVAACPSDAPHISAVDRLAFFPHLPRIRSRGRFQADTTNMTTAEKCKKVAKGHPHLLPGIFTLFCPHGVCLGFEAMRYHESPNVPFSLLRTRFASPPSLIIYDNSCSLHTYAYNRDPHLFRRTRFRVDALHFKNHTACGSSYELKQYPHLTHINSQVVEQANSRMKRIKTSLSFMTQENFMRHAKLYLWDQNKNVISRLPV